MELIKLNADIRTATGKGQARSLRREGRLPAVLYGPGTETASLSINCKEFEDTLRHQKGGQVLLNLVIQNGGEKIRSVMIKEIQRHPLSRDIVHTDFYEISMDRKIFVKVPVTVTGKSKGVELGGMLQIIRRELEIFCYPQNIPTSIEIDVTDLDIGESVHVKDIETEDDVEIPADVNFTIITVLSPKSAEEEEGEEEEGEEGEEAEGGEEAAAATE
ncbi:50S ribosomal protein L25 [Desulfobacterales bacterium HSG16]|nr:50S ribosomal protein L25 [Desulfobacterales bacterium HSG16]